VCKIAAASIKIFDNNKTEKPYHMVGRKDNNSILTIASDDIPGESPAANRKYDKSVRISITIYCALEIVITLCEWHPSLT